MTSEGPIALSMHGWTQRLEGAPSLAPFIKSLFKIGLILTAIGAVYVIAVSYESSLRAELKSTINLVFELILMTTVIWLAIRHRDAMLATLRRASPYAIAGAAIAGVLLETGELLSYAALSRHGLVNLHVSTGTHHETPTLVHFLIESVRVSICAPIVEEILFRGVLLTWLAKRMPVIIAAIVSSLIFAVFHLRMLTGPGLVGWIATTGAFVQGFVSAILVVKTRSLWPGIVQHTATNTTVDAIWLLLPWLLP